MSISQSAATLHGWRVKASMVYLVVDARLGQVRSDGGYIGIYTLPKSVPENYFVH